MPSSGMWRHVDLLLTDVSGERVSRWLPLAQADFSTLKMEAIRSPKRWLTQDLSGPTSYKMAFFIVTSVKTSIIHMEY
jgi:hypothetical protein